MSALEELKQRPEEYLTKDDVLRFYNELNDDNMITITSNAGKPFYLVYKHGEKCLIDKDDEILCMSINKLIRRVKNITQLALVPMDNGDEKTLTSIRDMYEINTEYPHDVLMFWIDKLKCPDDIYLYISTDEPVTGNYDEVSYIVMVVKCTECSVETLYEVTKKGGPEQRNEGDDVYTYNLMAYEELRSFLQTLSPSINCTILFKNNVWHGGVRVKK
jgi:hypothetical protein